MTTLVDAKSRAVRPGTVYQRLLVLIAEEPGHTEGALAFKLFGRHGCRSRISFSCQLLVLRGEVVRHGEGGARSPYRYRTSASSSPVGPIRHTDGPLR